MHPLDDMFMLFSFPHSTIPCARAKQKWCGSEAPLQSAITGWRCDWNYHSYSSYSSLPEEVEALESTENECLFAMWNSLEQMMETKGERGYRGSENRSVRAACTNVELHQTSLRGRPGGGGLHPSKHDKTSTYSSKDTLLFQTFFFNFKSSIKPISSSLPTSFPYSGGPHRACK